jgi:hypothetical protein
MSFYQVSSTHLAAIGGVHLGTGSQQRPDRVVDPVSVPPLETCGSPVPALSASSVGSARFAKSR